MDPGIDRAVGGPAGPVLHDRLACLVAELRLRDGEVRRGVPDGVHQLRVTCRRLRGALATFRPLVDGAVTDPLRRELRWVASGLGDGRDAEVTRDRLLALVATAPPSGELGPVRRRLAETYATRLRAADEDARALLTSARYRRLRVRLEALATSPPFTAAARLPAEEVLPARVAEDWRRLSHRVGRVQALQGAGASADGAAHAEALHDVRKAAKRLRYGGETLEPGWTGATALREAAQELTRVLGERRDAALACADLRRIAAEAAADGEPAVAYGALLDREEARGRELEAEFATSWRRVRDPGLRAWLR